jgi:hypothetical protein
MRTSDALDLEKGVFTKRTAKEVAQERAVPLGDVDAELPDHGEGRAAQTL